MFNPENNIRNNTDTRSNIIQIASELFAENGFDAVSIRQISKAANVNIALISYHFGSKEGLFVAILENNLPQMGENLRGIQEQTTTDWEKMCQAIDAYVARLFTNVAFGKILYREMSLNSRTAHTQRALDFIMKNMLLFEKIIEDGQKNNKFKKDIDVKMTIATIVGLIVQSINFTSFSVRLIGSENEADVFSEAHQNRIKKHLKEVMKAYLLSNV